MAFSYYEYNKWEDPHLKLYCEISTYQGWIKLSERRKKIAHKGTRIRSTRPSTGNKKAKIQWSKALKVLWENESPFIIYTQSKPSIKCGRRRKDPKGHTKLTLTHPFSKLLEDIFHKVIKWTKKQRRSWK